MPQSVQEVMRPDPSSCPDTATVAEAARVMASEHIGDVLVERSGKVCGIVTDRDLVVRAIAQGKDPARTKLAEICSADLTALAPGDTVEDAVRLMREKALRRLPVIQEGKLVGVVSLGDLAVERDPTSALAEISAAPPNT